MRDMITAKGEGCPRVPLQKALWQEVHVQRVQENSAQKWERKCVRVHGGEMPARSSARSPCADMNLRLGNRHPL
jgi:hypothetical protein